MTQAFESDFLPVVPLKKMVAFPGAIIPLFVMRSVSLGAIEEALTRDRRVFLVCQRASEVEEPSPPDLFEVGTVAEVLQILPEADGTAKVLVEGCYAARAINYPPAVEEESGLHALVVRNPVSGRESGAIQAHHRAVLNQFETYCAYSGRVPTDLMHSITGTRDPEEFVNAVAHHTTLKVEEKQQILESTSMEEKFILLNQFLSAENQLLELETKIQGQVKNQIGKEQREFYLNEQLKAIEQELGLSGEEDPELEELARAIEGCGMTEEAREKADRELSRLARMAPLAPEAAITRTYLEWLTELPWVESSDDQIDLKNARRILDTDHYGLESIKERILEYLAVVKLAGQARGPILCFVGPPGVGKTSLGASIARCVGRRFVRFSLGGVRDEAEVRGHRRTYVGALPGKIIQAMRRAGTVNPVILLDEIDKMSSDLRGDPASAMLEVLDPEQNRTFADHYLEVEYDLSQVMFLMTANSMASIPPPLLDRMEIIRLPGYTEDEKLHIATRHLMPKQRRAHGLTASQVKISKAAMASLITGYTREAGVRNLDRTLAAVCRKVAVQVVQDPKSKPMSVRPGTLRDLLGPMKFRDKELERAPEVGSAVGLAWTEVGGELLTVETTLMKGKGKLILTGQLGDVMRESAQTALSYIRSHANRLDIDPDFYEKLDIHIHLPEGAIPKDGPSAGITLATSMASALSGYPVRQDCAMTGETTLRGKVLKIGGLKEKALAAYRNKIMTVLIPRDNIDDVEEISEEVRAKLDFVPVDGLMDVLDRMLVRDKKTAPPKDRSPKSGAKRGRVTPRLRA
ncbi:MAG: endopeptidase La [Sumerlaeia bacterium]